MLPGSDLMPFIYLKQMMLLHLDESALSGF